MAGRSVMQSRDLRPASPVVFVRAEQHRSTCRGSEVQSGGLWSNSGAVEQVGDTGPNSDTIRSTSASFGASVSVPSGPHAQWQSERERQAKSRSGSIGSSRLTPIPSGGSLRSRPFMPKMFWPPPSMGKTRTSIVSGSSRLWDGFDALWVGPNARRRGSRGRSVLASRRRQDDPPPRLASSRGFPMIVRQRLSR